MLLGIVVAGVLVDMICSPGISSVWLGYDGIAGVGNVGVVVDVGTECVCSGLVVVVEAVVTSGAWSSVSTTDVIGSGSVGGSKQISVFLVSNVVGA